MQKLDRAWVLDLIYQSFGKIFWVEFKKKDGTMRQMRARLGVKKYLKGGKLAYDPLAKSLISVFDVNKEEYRMINLNTLTKLSINGMQFEVVDG